MSTEAPNHYVTKFIDQITHVFQPRGRLLQGVTRPPVKFEANTVKFPIIGRGEAVALQRGSIGPAMNAARTMITATVADYQANDWVYEADLEKLNYDENSVVAETCGKAIGRKKDLLIINELNTVSATIVDATNAGAIIPANAPFSLVMALAGITTIENQNVFSDDGEVYCGMPPVAFQQFISYRQVNDADWVGYDGQPYKTGVRYKLWNGVKWFRLPLEYCPIYATNVGGVTGANTIDFFLWHKNAIGFADNYDVRSTVTWENLYSGWYHNTRFAGVAKTLLPPGVIRFRIGANSALTIN